MPTQDPLLLPLSALGNFISGYMAPPGQVAVNVVPRFACCRQFGTRNRDKYGYEWSTHLSFRAPLPAQVTFVLPVLPLFRLWLFKYQIAALGSVTYIVENVVEQCQPLLTYAFLQMNRCS